MTRSYMTYTPRLQVVDYLADLLKRRDHWFFLIPVQLAEPVLGALVQFPDSMLFLDQGSPEICVSGGRQMLIPLAAITGAGDDAASYGILATVPRGDVTRQDIIEILNLPEDVLKANQFVLGLASTKNGAPAVFPTLFTDALALADPASKDHFRQHGTEDL